MGTPPPNSSQKRSALLGCLLFLAASGSSNAQVQCEFRINNLAAPLNAGARIEGQLFVTISPGWHIAGLRPASTGPSHTEISVPAGGPLKLAGEISGPKPHKEYSEAFDAEIESYSGTVIFKLPLFATASIDPGAKLSVVFGYQACSDATCLPPKIEKVSYIAGSKPVDRREEPGKASKP